MSKFIPVDPDKWAEMVKAWADLPRWKEICDELDARCNELKAENQRLRASSFVTAVPAHQYERIVKAGDELACALGAFHLLHRGRIDTTKQPDIVAWNAAKEGKQS
jgi:hypothetical protein